MNVRISICILSINQYPPSMVVDIKHTQTVSRADEEFKGKIGKDRFLKVLIRVLLENPETQGWFTQEYTGSSESTSHWYIIGTVEDYKTKLLIYILCCLNNCDTYLFFDSKIYYEKSIKTNPNKSRTRTQ